MSSPPPAAGPAHRKPWPEFVRMLLITWGGLLGVGGLCGLTIAVNDVVYGVPLAQAPGHVGSGLFVGAACGSAAALVFLALYYSTWGWLALGRRVLSSPPAAQPAAPVGSAVSRAAFPAILGALIGTATGGVGGAIAGAAAVTGWLVLNTAPNMQSLAYFWGPIGGLLWGLPVGLVLGAVAGAFAGAVAGVRVALRPTSTAPATP